MHRQNIIAAGLLVLIAALVVTAGYRKGLGPFGVINAGITRLTGGNSSDGLVPETKSATAPEFAAGTWINSEPLTLKGLSGRVVVVEFWTFGCYNCRNTLPFVNAGTNATVIKGSPSWAYTRLSLTMKSRSKPCAGKLLHWEFAFP